MEFISEFKTKYQNILNTSDCSNTECICTNKNNNTQKTSTRYSNLVSGINFFLFCFRFPPYPSPSPLSPPSPSPYICTLISYTTGVVIYSLELSLTRAFIAFSRGIKFKIENRCWDISLYVLWMPNVMNSAWLIATAQYIFSGWMNCSTCFYSCPSKICPSTS